MADLCRDGVADQQLAKLEAERAKEQELNWDADKDQTASFPKRGRSASYDSVSTISTTRSISRSPGPSGYRRHQDARSPSPTGQQRRRGSYGSSSARAVRRSRSPAPQGEEDRYHRRGPGHSDKPHTGAFEDSANPAYAPPGRRTRRQSSSLSRSRSPSPVAQHRYRSRSPAEKRADHAPIEQSRHHYQNLGRHSPPHRRRERSLSPFSKRLAITRSMKK